MVVAIHSEILSGNAASSGHPTLADARRALSEATPRATAEANGFVFEGVDHDITMLPHEVVNSVAHFHRLARQSVEMIRDLRDPAFLRRSPKEKQKYLHAFFQIAALQKVWGKAAVADLERYAAKGTVNLAKRRQRADALFGRARRKLAAIIAHLDDSDACRATCPSFAESEEDPPDIEDVPRKTLKKMPWPCLKSKT